MLWVPHDTMKEPSAMTRRLAEDAVGETQGQEYIVIECSSHTYSDEIQGRYKRL